MVITGRIFDIVIISDKVAQIVIRKKLSDKIVPVAITVYGYWKDKALNELKLKPKDKIKGNLYLKSRLYNGKYYTDVFFKEIYIAEEFIKTKLNGGGGANLFQSDGTFLDLETGEIMESE